MSELGHDGTLTIGQVVQYVKDLNLNMDATEVDDTTRANAGWRSRRTGLRQWSADFSMVVKQGDTMFGTLQAAFANKTSVTVNVKDKFGNEVEGLCSVSRFNRSEPLDDVVTVDVNLVGNGKPSKIVAA